MLIVDAHCDTLSEVLEKKIDIFQNEGHLDIKRLYENKKSVQFFAVFVKPGNEAYTLANALKQIDILYQAEKEYSRYLEVAYNTEDIERILSEGKAAAILSIEGGEALSRDLGVLRMLHRLGVRATRIIRYRIPITPILGMTVMSSSAPETTKNIRNMGGVTLSTIPKISSPEALVLTRAIPMLMHKSKADRFRYEATATPKNTNPQVMMSLLDCFLK